MTHASLDAVLKAVMTETGYDYRDLTSPCKMPEVCRARHLISYLGSRFCRAGNTVIGKRLNRDQSAIVAGIKRVRSNRAYFEPELSRLEELLEQVAA